MFKFFSCIHIFQDEPVRTEMVTEQVFRLLSKESSFFRQNFYKVVTADTFCRPISLISGMFSWAVSWREMCLSMKLREKNVITLNTLLTQTFIQYLIPSLVQKYW